MDELDQEQEKEEWRLTQVCEFLARYGYHTSAEELRYLEKKGFFEFDRSMGGQRVVGSQELLDDVIQVKGLTFNGIGDALIKRVLKGDEDAVLDVRNIIDKKMEALKALKEDIMIRYKEVLYGEDE